MTTYIRTHGRRLRWTVATLQQAGIEVQRVDRGLGSNYYLTVEADADQVDAALQDLAGYKPRRKGKAPAQRAMDAITLGGLVVAVLAGLVSPPAGAIVLALLVFYRFVFGKLRENAQAMRAAGGFYALAAGVGILLVLLFMAGSMAIVAALAAEQIAAGNSALSLLER